MAKPFKPKNFGRYLLTDRIATGGMAEIFAAKVFGAMGFEKQLVIKRILPQYASDNEFLQMFITEAKLVCHLEHPNIIQVHELGEISGQYYIAMEYINGIDARQLWRALAKRKQRLPGLLALFIVSEFLKGLDYAHRAIGPDGQILGVVHRDVSPSNIVISFRGDVKIGDFGIALVHQESKTQAGVLKGKFGYMTPEQVAGLKVDHRSDIFSAGIVLAELLLGRRLFMGQSYFETLDKVLNVRLDVLQEHESALPPEVVKIVRRALAREVDNRFQTAKEFHEAIYEFLYERRARISNENLASFIAEHVAPYIARGKETSPSSSKSPSPSPVVRAPMVPAIDIQPQLLKGTKGAQENPQDNTSRSAVQDGVENELLKEFGVEADPVAAEALTSDSGTESVPHPFLGGDENVLSDQDILEQHDILDEETDMQTDRAISIDPALLADPNILSGEEVLADQDADQDTPTDGKVPVEQIAADDGQFGAIPVYESDSGPIATRKKAAAASSEEVPPDYFEGAEEELNMEQWSEEEFNINPFILDPDEPSVLVSRRLVSAHAENASDGAAFTGKLASQSVTQVLYKCMLDEESGLMVLSGPESAGRQAEVLDWLRFLQASSRAETDSAREDGRTCSIHLMNGQPHLASADRNEEALVAFLIRTDVLSEEKVEKSIRSSPQRKPVAALLAEGVLAPLQVLRHLTAFVLDSVLETFAWLEGDFAFYRGKENPSEAFPTGLEAMELISKGIANILEPDLDNYFQQLSGMRVFLNPKPKKQIEDFGMNEMLHAAHRELEIARPVEEALQAFSSHADSLAAKQMLYMFLECDLALPTV